MRQRLTLGQFAKALPALAPEVEQATIRGLRSAAQRGVGFLVDEIDHASPSPAVNLGDLRRSVTYEPTPDGAVLDVAAPHAAPINFGTRPFRPPLAPLILWAQQKGIAADDKEAKRIAWAVASKIEKDGIAPRHFANKAYARMWAIAPDEVAVELERVT